MALTVERELPDEDARDLIALTRDLVDRSWLRAWPSTSTTSGSRGTSTTSSPRPG